MDNRNDFDHNSVKRILQLVYLIMALCVVLIAMPLFFAYHPNSIQKFFKSTPTSTLTVKTEISSAKKDTIAYWRPPNVDTISDARHKANVQYGRELITHTSRYFGPNGSILKMSNGMNCQNCHLEAGTKIFGNNYGSVASLYPKFRARSGKKESIYKRVNDCFERSLNGKALDTLSKEMQAIVSYIKFVGANVEKGKKAFGSGFKDLAFINRAADAVKGKIIYQAVCKRCHQAGGDGILNAASTEFTYPALWGKQSYNDGAGLYRITNFAKYVKYNMPMGITYQYPQLSDEEAYDVAAYVNSQPRPHLNTPNDWPDKSLKPIDYPFGPYVDKFSEREHKYGPFKPISEEQKKKENIATTKI